MKKFLYKIAGFTGLLGLVLFCLKQSVPYYWGNRLFEIKAKFLNQTTTPPNTFFVGNSRIYRHIAPLEFDSIAGTLSYNLGVDGMFFLETQYMLEHFMENYPYKNKLDNLFLSKVNYAPLTPKMRHTNRSQFYMDFKRLQLSTCHFLGKRDFEQFYYHWVSFVENQLCIGQVKSILKYHFREPMIPNPLMVQQKGFLGLDEQIRPTLKDQEVVRSNQKEVHIKSITNPPYNFSQNLPQLHYFEPGGLDLERKYYFDPAHFKLEGAKIYSKKLGEAFRMMNDE